MNIDLNKLRPSTIFDLMDDLAADDEDDPRLKELEKVLNNLGFTVKKNQLKRF